MNNNDWNLEDAYAHLKADPVIQAVINVTGKIEPLLTRNLYLSLLSSVISQQLSTKAASTIWSRFDGLFSGDPNPKKLMSTPIDELRNVGISYQKAGYLNSIAEFAAGGKLNDSTIGKFDDEELVTYLTQIKGVGRWTAEMILIFSLNRPDVFPVDDLGVRQSVLTLYGIPDHGKLTSSGLVELSTDWRPYRSVVSRHLWRLRDGFMK